MEFEQCDGIGIDDSGDFLFCGVFFKDKFSGTLCRFYDSVILHDDASYTSVSKVKSLKGSVRNYNNFIIQELVYG